MLVKEIMSSPPIVCDISATVEDAVELMANNQIGVLPIVDSDGALVGVITENDFLPKYLEIPGGITSTTLMGEFLEASSIEEILAEIKNRPVKEAMNIYPSTTHQDTNLQIALQKMQSDNETKIVVTENGVPVGVVSSHDVMKAVLTPSIQNRFDCQGMGSSGNVNRRFNVEG